MTHCAGRSHGAFIKGSVASICHFFNVFFSSLYLIIPKGLFLLPFILLLLVHIRIHNNIGIHRNILFIAGFSRVSVISSNLLHDVHIKTKFMQSNHSVRKKVFSPLCAFHNANTVSVKKSLFAKGQ